ncbi:MAG: ATP-binding protein, partial [Methanoregula sp.]
DQRTVGCGGASNQSCREQAMEGSKFGVGLYVITQQTRNVDENVLGQINEFVVMGLGDRGDREIIMGSAKQDLSKMEIEIQTLDQGEAILSTIGIPFPVSTRIHEYETYIAMLNAIRKKDVREGLDTGFS